MNKINIKLSLLIGVLSFLIALGIGNYANNISTVQLEKNSGESLLKLAESSANILDREMLERYREIKFASTLPVMINEDSTQEQRRTLIEQIKNNYNHHEWIGYALPDGTVNAGTKGYLEGKNAKGRPWHPAGLKGPYIGDVHDALLLSKLLPNTSGEAIYFIDVAFPVKTKENKVLGVLCTHLTWQWTRDVIRTIEKENDVEIFLLSKDGLVLVGPSNTERIELSEVSKDISNKFLREEKSLYGVNSWNTSDRYLTAHTVSKGFEEYKGFGWKVIVRKPVNSAFSEANKNSNKILFASILIGLVGTILGMIVSNRISSPLNNLSSKVIDFRKGKDVVFLDDSSNDEIGLLEKELKELCESIEKESNLKNIAEDKVNISLSIFEQSIEGIIVTDKDNNIILINKAFEDITGYKMEDVYGRNPSLLSAKTLGKDFYQEMWNDIKKNGKWEGKVSNKRKDNSLYEEELRISTIRNDKNEIINYIATFNSTF